MTAMEPPILVLTLKRGFRQSSGNANGPSTAVAARNVQSESIVRTFFDFSSVFVSNLTHRAKGYSLLKREAKYSPFPVTSGLNAKVPASISVLGISNSWKFEPSRFDAKTIEPSARKDGS